ncbi:SMR family transporter [Anaerosinus massiliensis]|uniref:SMR family transporter n=1 Tax=Massilibacillus massiliensis TaxID=1806837 RepID=UPI000DA633EB|nr:SMR family transporter [Massilibacillus massiliensis]
MLQWCALFLAIITEVTGTTMLKFVGQNESIAGYTVLLIMVGLSYFLLSKAIVKIPLSVAYATWEGIGLVVITGIGCILFQEQLSVLKILGVSIIVLGIILLKRGMVESASGDGKNE